MDPNIQKIVDIFSSDFNATFSYMKGKQQRSLAYLAPTLFIRWYYSALFSETILSPAAIIENQRGNTSNGKGFHSLCLRLKNVNGDHLEFKFKKNFYSIESHPIYNDLDILLEYMAPAISVDKSLALKESDLRALQRRLSISDRYYVIYLFELAGKLGLYNELPSLYEKQLQPIKNNNFFALSPDERLNSIVDKSCELCVSAIKSEFPLDSIDIDKFQVRKLIEEPSSIDDILINIFDSSDIDIQKLLEGSEQSELSEDDNSLLSSVFYMGMILDRYFIYVFGHYLRLIRPLYSYPVNFRVVLNSLFNALAVDTELEPDLFMPCTAYVHTPLGSIFFGRRIIDMSKYPPIPIDRLLVSLEKERNLSELRLKDELMKSEYDVIYTLRANFNGEADLWKIIEIESSIPVSVTAHHIMMLFMLPTETNYEFRLKKGSFIDFSEIEALSDPSSSLSDILSEKGSSLIMNLSDGQFIELRLIDIHSGYFEIMYPRILEQSKNITEKEHNLYFYD